MKAGGNGRIICYDPRNNPTRTILPRLDVPKRRSA